MVPKYGTQIDVIMEIKQELTSAHLMLEEASKKTKAENLDPIVTHIDTSVRFTRAFLEGGKTSHGYIYALEDADLQEQLSLVRDQLERFRRLVVQRWTALGEMQSSPELDQKLDELYQEIMNRTDQAEKKLHARLELELSRFQMLQSWLLGALILIAIFMGFLLSRYITLRNNTLKEIKNSEAKFRKFFKTSRDAVFITSPKGEWIDMNEATVNLLGYPDKKSLMNVPVEEVYYDPRERSQHLREIISSGFTKDYPVDLVGKDGKIIHTLITSVPVYDEEGNIRGFQGSIHDHTYIEQTEEALREERNKLRQITETSPVSIIRMDLEGNIVYGNRRAEEVLDLNRYKIKQKTYDDPDWKITDVEGNPFPSEQLPFARVKNSGKPVYGIRHAIEMQDGRKKLLEVNAAPVFGGKGELTSIVATVQDITERISNEKHIEHLNSVLNAVRKINQLIIREEKRSVITQEVCNILTSTRNFTNAWLALVNEKQEVVMANASGIDYRFQSFQNRLKEGYQPECMRRVLEEKTTFIPDKSQHCRDCPLTDSYEGTGNISLCLKHRNQVYGILNVSLPVEILKNKEELTLLEELAHDIGFALYNIELSEEKASMERSLMQSEHKFRTLMENAFDGIYLTKGKHFEYVNHRFCEITGYSARELTAPDFNFDQLLTEESKRIVSERYKARTRNEKIPHRYEMQLLTGEGRVKYVELSTVSIDHAQEISVMGIMRDVTQRKLAEQELLKAKKKAEESDRLKSAFLANMSHEIRTPMNGILGFTQLLKDQEFPKEKQQEFLEIIDSRSHHLLQLINDIIDISKIEAGQLQISKKDFSLNRLLKELYDLYSSELKNRGKTHIELELATPLEDENSAIHSDELRLRQILTNLLSNGVKFTESGQITFGYELPDQQSIRFFVRDSGPGIPADQQEIIFDRFRQANESVTREYGGTGLGLAICKNLVEQIGGKLWVHSKEGEGSVFYFTIPQRWIQKEEDIRKADQESFQTLISDLNGHQILIVEDDAFSRQYIREILAPTNADIILAETGEQAYRLFLANQDRLSLILMDIRLPDINGLEITRKIRQKGSTLPIIAQTAYAMAEDKSQSLKAGCNDYISKPIDSKMLLSKIYQYI